MRNTVHRMDCMELMEELPENYFDLAIVDPPYGNKYDAVNLIDSKTNKARRTKLKVIWDNEPEERYFKKLLEISKDQIIWGANFFNNFNFTGGYLCWNKNGTAFGEAELAYNSKIMSIKIFEYTWNGMIQQNMKNKENRIHPTQKPVALYKWLLTNYAKPGQTIFDSHVGSGSSRIACYDMGFEFCGCELDEDYHAAQEQRFQNHIKQADLFTPEERQEMIYKEQELF